MVCPYLLICAHFPIFPHVGLFLPILPIFAHFCSFFQDFLFCLGFLRCFPFVPILAHVSPLWTTLPMMAHICPCFPNFAHFPHVRLLRFCPFLLIFPSCPHFAHFCQLLLIYAHFLAFLRFAHFHPCWSILAYFGWFWPTFVKFSF